MESLTICGDGERMSRPKWWSGTRRHHDGTSVRWLRIAAVAVALIALPGCEKYRLDRQMEERCKKDGGVKVYETITLSPAEYKALFEYKVAAKSREDYYGPAYRYVESRTIIAGVRNRKPGSGRGQLVREYEALYRKSDDRLLGEGVLYARVGGDVITFGFQPSEKSCPNPRVSLITVIFNKEV
jgi:hypothetical protein